MTLTDIGYDWTTFEHAGLTFRAKIERDDDMGAPWDEHDGRGPVSDWTTRDKLPGELVLSEDRRGRSKRFYDFAEACRIARKEGCGFLPGPLVLTADPGDHAPYAKRGGRATCGDLTAHDPEDMNRAITAVYAMHRATMTAREYAAKAAMRDFEHLRDWCLDRWEWVGVIVERIETDEDDEEIETGESVSLWGIESSDESYLIETALELADELIPDDAKAAA